MAVSVRTATNISPMGKPVIRRGPESPRNETGVFSTWKRRAPVSRHGSCHPVHRALSGFDRLSPRPQRPDRHRHGQHRADHRRAVHPSRSRRPQAEHAGRMGVRTAGDKGAVPGRQVTLVPAARCAATVSTAGERADGRERQAARSDPEAAASSNCPPVICPVLSMAMAIRALRPG